MCGICGFINHHQDLYFDTVVTNNFQSLLEKTSVRGHDSVGISVMVKIPAGEYKIFSYKSEDVTSILKNNTLVEFLKRTKNNGRIVSAIINFRAEPTTEKVSIRDDFTMQPFIYGDGAVVHNGIISNDVELINQYKFKPENYTREEKLIDSWSILAIMNKAFQIREICGLSIKKYIEDLQGGFAFAYQNIVSGETLLARNFRGLAIQSFSDVTFFASDKSFLPNTNLYTSHDLVPWSGLIYKPRNSMPEVVFFDDSCDYIKSKKQSSKAVVVCSGGLDSTTVATMVSKTHDEVILMHFLYGCKAEKSEKQAIINIVEFLNNNPIINAKVSYEFIDMTWLKNLGGSVLTDESLHKDIAIGDTGVETTNAWVPARNLVFLSIAGAYCDKHGISEIYLGSNMEEGSVFEDNTYSFVQSLEYTMKFGTKSKPSIIAPLKNAMKKDIVKLAIEYGAPIHLSHSCYHEEPCTSIHNECGPCRMKRIALEENNITLDYFRNL